MSATESNVGRRGYVWQHKIRPAVLAESDTCWICGLPGADTVDHIVPMSKGGHPTHRSNLAPAHMLCNTLRSADITIHEASTHCPTCHQHLPDPVALAAEYRAMARERFLRWHLERGTQPPERTTLDMQIEMFPGAW